MKKCYNIGARNPGFFLCVRFLSLFLSFILRMIVGRLNKICIGKPDGDSTNAYKLLTKL